MAQTVWPAVQSGRAPSPAGLEGRWLIQVAADADPRASALAAGADYLGPLQGVAGYHRVNFVRQLESRPGAGDARQVMERQLAAQPAIRRFEKDGLLERYPRAVAPGDPLFPSQWHLENAGQSGGVRGADANVPAAWDSGLSGQGVTIAIVDEGIQFRHPDLLPNWLNGSGYDYNDRDTDPSPVGSDDRHGTAVAGITLAASNGIGGLGVAHRARLVPLRLIAGPFEIGQEAEALSYNTQSVSIYNNSWGPSDEGGVMYEDASGVLKSALAANTSNGRGGLGNIYVWAAGNGGLNGDNSNYDGYNALPYTISVGAVGDDDVRATYSEPGANLLVVAPSLGRGAGIVTTDNTGASGYADGDYYDAFSGTSAAAPVVSGVVALMLERRPQLNWRDVQQVLARTAVPVDFSPDKWARNGAGLWVSHEYGFGRVDAAAAVELARDWVSLPAPLTASNQRPVGATLTQDVAVENAITITQSMEVQFVRVTLTLNHSDWGDLRVELVSPSGTRSVLSEPHPNFNNPGEPGVWTYLSTRHLGEDSAGAWRLAVTDAGTGGSGSWTRWAIEIIGHATSGRTNRPPAGGDIEVQSTTYPVEIDTAAGLSDPDGDALALVSVQNPRHGTLEDLGGGRFLYSMGAGSDGSDTFSVLYGDGRGAVSRRVVTVRDPRPAARNDVFPVLAGFATDLPVLANDLDPDGDPLRLLSVTGSPAWQAAVQPGGTIRFTAPAGVTGLTRLNYTIGDDSDGESSAWAAVITQQNPDVALRFDGVDDYMQLPPTNSILLYDGFTAEAWIRPESYGEYVTGFGRIYDRGTFILFLNGFDHSFYNDRSLVAYFVTDDGQSIAANSAANVISLDQWQHVAVSYSTADTSQPVRMYVNGKPVALSYPLEGSSAPRRPLSDNRGYALYMGESDSGARAFKGSMTEFRIWARVLGPSEILQYHDRRVSGGEGGLRLYFPLDGSLGPTAVSKGVFTGAATISGAQRVPRELPWGELERHYTLVSDSGSGWWVDRTLGWLYGDSFPWIYLPSLKWVYTGHGPVKDSYTLYRAAGNWGWLQTTSALHPWWYRTSSGTWLWHWPGTSNPAWFYDAGRSVWVADSDDLP